MEKRNNNNKRKFDKRNQRPKKDFRKEDESSKKFKYNDPSWYTPNGQLLKDFASISFNSALGANTVLKYSNGGTYQVSDIDYTAPGIMRIVTAPTFGVSRSGASAVNLAARSFYTNIRSWNSGHSNYNAPDLMMYFGAMDSLYSFIGEMTRAYGIAKAFSQTNRYIGDLMLYGMGWDPNIRKNLADFRGYINMCIGKVSAFCTPTTMPLFKRHYWMYSGLYRDTDVIKSQTYGYVPGVLWKYNEFDGAGQLTPVRCHVYPNATANTLTFSYLDLASAANIFDDLMSAVSTSEDINIMSGDILKAYGADGIWRLELIPEDYAVFPVYSEEVLDQIHNTRFCGNRPTLTTSTESVPPVTLDAFVVTQDPTVGDGMITCGPQFINAAHLGFDAIVDITGENPDPERVMTSTRNIAFGNTAEIPNTTDSITTLTSCGSDVCLFGVIITADKTTPNGFVYQNMWTNQNDYPVTYYQKVSAFNRYPITITVNQSNKATSVFGELDNYTCIPESDISKMHDTALMSQLGVPFLGT